MDKIAQDSQYRQRMMLYTEHHGIEETANRYHVSRKTVWKWSKRWDGTAKSLEEKSRRPKSSRRKQKPWEIELVKRMRKKYGEDLLLGYQKAREKGYKRSYGCFKRTAEKEIPLKKKAPKRKNKPYQRASYPGQKVQIDVKCPATAWQMAGNTISTRPRMNVHAGHTGKCTRNTAHTVLSSF